jgi:hypothetical protein
MELDAEQTSASFPLMLQSQPQQKIALKAKLKACRDLEVILWKEDLEPEGAKYSAEKAPCRC